MNMGQPSRKNESSIQPEKHASAQPQDLDPTGDALRKILSSLIGMRGLWKYYHGGEGLPDIPGDHVLKEIKDAEYIVFGFMREPTN